MKRHDNGEFCIVCIYVDDMIYLGSFEILVAEFKSCMKKEFEMIDLGLLLHFLGLEVKQVEDGIFLSQRNKREISYSGLGCITVKWLLLP